MSSTPESGTGPDVRCDDAAGSAELHPDTVEEQAVGHDAEPVEAGVEYGDAAGPGPDAAADRSVADEELEAAELEVDEVRPSAASDESDTASADVDAEPDTADAGPDVAEQSGQSGDGAATAEPAAGATEVQPEVVGVKERIRAMFGRPSRSQFVVGLLLAALGFAAVTQVRSNELDDSYENLREEELIDIFNGLTGTSDRTRREIARLEQARRELQVDTSARTAAIEQAEQRLRTLNVLAGLVPVTGPGLRITVTETEGRISIDSLLDMVQELRTAGAEAMEFNGEVRVVASSSFSDVDGVIHLDGVPLRSPYVLEVIGESHTLNTGVTFPSGPVATLREDESAEVEIEELDSVDIESVRELSGAEFAEPAEAQ